MNSFVLLVLVSPSQASSTRCIYNFYARKDQAVETKRRIYNKTVLKPTFNKKHSGFTLKIIIQIDIPFQFNGQCTKEKSFLLNISSAIMTKSTVYCEFRLFTEEILLKNIIFFAVGVQYSIIQIWKNISTNGENGLNRRFRSHFRSSSLQLQALKALLKRDSNTDVFL